MSGEWTPWALAEAYARGENITALLRESGAAGNAEAAILTAYDLQAGSYVARMADAGFRDALDVFARSVARELLTLGPQHSLLEAGVGEATFLRRLLEVADPLPAIVHACDLSWSRVAVARDWLAAGRHVVELKVARMSALPYRDASFDVVLTSHAIEPNHGREAELLAELYRVASRWLVLTEPAYEFASPDVRARMDALGYCRDLAGHARRLGMEVVRSELLLPRISERNPTAITLIAKQPSAPAATPALVCPRWRTPLEDLADCSYSPGSLTAYPRIGGIDCLIPEHGVIAGQLRRRDGGRR